MFVVYLCIRKNKKYISYFHCLFILLLAATRGFADLACQSQSDCNDKSTVHCGICTDNHTPGTGKCIFPFPFIFKDTSKCTLNKSCERMCNKRGECHFNSKTAHTFILIPNCDCNAGFYGRACEHTTPEDKVGAISKENEVEFKGKVNPGEINQNKYIYSCIKKEISTFTLEVQCYDGGFLELLAKSKWKCSFHPYILQKFKTRFPYKPFKSDNSKNVLKLGNKVLGYLSSYQFKLVEQELVTFDKNIPIFVSYEEANLICVPVVEISGCSSRKDFIVVLSRSNLIRISSKVAFIANGKYLNTSVEKPECEKYSTFSWKVWNNSDENSSPYGQFYHAKDLFFGSYILPFGSYKVLLEVKVVQDKPSQSFAYCYFNVTFTPFVAIIDGGSERTVNKDVGLILTSSLSHDPNMPSNQQRHMKIRWKCVDISKPNVSICDPVASFPVSSTLIVPSEKLRYGGVYNVTLTVWTNYYKSCLLTSLCGTVIPTAYANALITVANKSDEGEDYIYIQCLLNCKNVVIQSQELYLKVKTSAKSKGKGHKFKWTYYSKEEMKEKDTENLTMGGMPSFMFLAKENAFRRGKSYVVVVRILNSTWSAKYAFQTQKEDFNGNCSLTPTFGTLGLSLFDVVCENFSSASFYEFYDKTLQEAQVDSVFNGRMLGTSEQSERGELRNFRITRGHILVYITDISGSFFTCKMFTVNLTKWDVTIEDIGDIYKNLAELLTHGETAKMLEYISAIPDIFLPKMDKHQILGKLLNLITLVPTDTLSDIKITTSTLTNVLLTFNKPIQLTIEPNLMRDILQIVKNQTRLLSTMVSEEIDLKGMTPKEIRTVATYQLDCLHAALMCKDPRTVGVTEFDLDFKTLEELMGSSNFAEDAIYLIKDILTFIQAPGQPPTKISAANDSYVLWVVKNDEEYDLPNYLNMYKDIPVSVPEKFIKEFGTKSRKNQEDLALRVANLRDNIFWWSKSDVQSHLVSVSFAKHKKGKPLGRIMYVKNNIAPSIQTSLHSGLRSIQVTGIATYYNSTSKCDTDKDLLIEVHRLDPLPKSQISLRFLFPETNGSLKVHVLKDFRPDCYLMKTHFETITEQYPTYSLPIICSEEEPTFYYIGIVPLSNQRVSYTFEVNTTVCQFWERGHWSSQGCKISLNKTNNLKALCACNHFSIFAAAFPVPPQEIDLFSDMKLFLDVFQNPLVVSFVLIILLVFLIGCFWAWRKDSSDRRLKNVIVLDDNFPEDPYPYLLAVYTSSRFNAGTTAHVGMQIKGSLASSRHHIFSSKERKVLKRNYDDWFLVYSPQQLGDVLNIHLWHDDAGPSPDWFCDKIIVYDLTNNFEVMFAVEQWIALRLTYFPEAYVRGAPVSEVNTVKRIFLDNCILGLREGHTLLCIILRHPRSEISRLQRICVLMCCIISAMLCSIMFYSPDTPVDYNEYSVGTRDIYISLESLAITLIITFVVLFAFKRSHKHSKTQPQSSVSKEFNARNKGTKKKSVYSNFVRFVTKTLKGNPLVPAQLEQSKSLVTIRKKWYFLAWTLCISVIIVCSFFIMLYGLKLGPSKSKKWLSSVVLTLIGEFFVTSPAKIILFSIILSLAFQKMCEMDNHQVNLTDILHLKPSDDEEQIQKLLVKRSHPMYAPLSSATINELLRKKELWSNWWTLIDFTVALCFIFVVSMVVFQLWSSHYYTNSQVLRVMTESHHESLGYEDFFSIRFINQVECYLKESFFRALYNTFWYNKKPIKEDKVDREYWAEDFTYTMVGYQRVRQIRVLPIRCLYKYFNTTGNCIPHYSNATEDTDDYGARWKTARFYDVKKADSPWKYTGRSFSRISTMYRLCGKSGTIFDDGGYLTHLGPTMEKSEAVVSELIRDKWQDQLTRAVFLEFTLFNINKNLFTQVTMIVEYLIAGKIQLKAQVFSVESKIRFSFLNALFAVFVIYYIIRTGYLINRQGLMEYLSTSSRNKSRLLIVVLGTLSIVNAIVHFFTSTAYYKSFINTGYEDTYFQFDRFYFYFKTLQMILSVLLCVAIFRTILMFRGGRSLLNYFYTFTMSLQWICWLTFILLVFLIIQVPLIFLLNIYSFYSVQEFILNFKFTQYFKSQRLEMTYIKIFFYIKSVAISIFMSFYIVIFVYYGRIAQTYKIRSSDNFNLIIFLFNQIKKLKKKKAQLSVI